MGNIMTATEAAKLIGCSIATVTRWARRLGFDAKYGSCLILNREQVEEIKRAKKSTAGNPNFGK